MKAEDMSAGIIRKISEFLYSDEHQVEIDGEIFAVKIASNGCRYIKYHGITFMEQNQNKTSAYAYLARHGYKIVWGMFPNKWMYIRDHVQRSPAKDKEIHEGILAEERRVNELINRWM
jgi:hypothetical protein